MLNPDIIWSISLLNSGCDNSWWSIHKYGMMGYDGMIHPDRKVCFCSGYLLQQHWVESSRKRCAETRVSRSLALRSLIDMFKFENFSATISGLLYIYTYIYTYIYIYIHTYIHAYILTDLHTYRHTYKHTNIRTYVRTDRHTYIHLYIRTHTYIHTYRQTDMQTCRHAYRQTYTHTDIHACMHTYTHIYMYLCIYTYIRTYIHTFTYTHTYIRTYIHSNLNIIYIINIYICTFTHQTNSKQVFFWAKSFWSVMKG